MEGRMPLAEQRLSSKRIEMKRGKGGVPMKSTTENITPTAGAELDERNLEAVAGGIIIIGGVLAMPFQSVIPPAEAATFLRY